MRHEHIQLSRFFPQPNNRTAAESAIRIPDCLTKEQLISYCKTHGFILEKWEDAYSSYTKQIQFLRKERGC